MKRALASLLVIVVLAGLEPATPQGVIYSAAARTQVPGGNPRTVRVRDSRGAVGEQVPGGNRAATLSSSSLIGPIYTASATWCKPRGNQCLGWDGDVYLGAVNSFRWGDPVYVVRVWRGQAYVDVTITSFCQCGDSLHAIDLSVAAWTKLEPNLDIGRIDVLVEVLGEGPRVTLPPTDQ